MTIMTSEKEDFDSAVARAGHRTEDFEITEKDDPTPAGCVLRPTGEVTVKNKPNGCACTYKAGNGTAWVPEFEEDLEAGVFGRPQ